jgi:hypothetical protein
MDEAAMGATEVTTAFLMAAALAMAQAEATPPPAPAAPQASVVVPTAQPAGAPAPAAPAAADPAPGAPVVSTAPQDDLDSPPTVRPFEMPAEALPVPIPYEPADAPVKTSVKVESYNRSYEGPQDAQEAYYEAGVNNAYQAEEALRGPLEGMWIVSTADGAPLLSLVISDPGRPDAPPGGAWRDLSRAHDPDASGLIDQVVVEGASVIVQIRLKPGAAPSTLRLTPAGDGRWRGLLLDGGRTRPVLMDRKPI